MNSIEKPTTPKYLVLTGSRTRYLQDVECTPERSGDEHDGGVDLIVVRDDPQDGEVDQDDGNGPDQKDGDERSNDLCEHESNIGSNAPD